MSLIPPDGPASYFPFLKGKAGEFAALAQLSREDKDKLLPLIDVPPERIRFWSEEVLNEGERVRKHWFQIDTIDEALDGYAAKLHKAWGGVDECLVDLAGFDPMLRLQNGAHPVTAFFAEARDKGLAAIPVTGPDRDMAQVDAVREACQAWPPRDVAIRLRRPLLEQPNDLGRTLDELLKQLEVGASRVHLLLDFGELIKSTVESTEEAARKVIEALPEIEAWQSLVVCMGAFPAELGNFVSAREVKSLPRRDRQLWKRLATYDPPLPRVPAFGDYCSTYADWKSAFDPTQMSVSAKIVYTTDQDWVVSKGAEYTGKNGPQYYDLAAQISGHADFFGSGHCDSDDKILECARKQGGPGNLGTWVTVATRHHIEVVNQQLAKKS